MTQPELLARSNPHIPKGKGNARVQAYLDATPGWKRRAGIHMRDRDIRETDEVEAAHLVQWIEASAAAGEQR